MFLENFFCILSPALAGCKPAVKIPQIDSFAALGDFPTAALGAWFFVLSPWPMAKSEAPRAKASHLLTVTHCPFRPFKLANFAADNGFAGGNGYAVQTPCAKGRQMGQGKMHKLLACGLLVVAILAPGCTRRFFRNSADREVESILTAKNKYPFWAIENWHVYPDPRARFADPTNPDRPPMPPDDPAAFALSPNPQKPGKAGVTRVSGTGYLELLGYWDAENRRERPEPEQKPGDVKEAPGDAMPKAEARGQQEDAAVQQAYQKVEEPPTLAGACGLPGGTPSQPFLIKLEQASELALINSREFQARREGLYLSALPVTLERF